jgi:cell division protein FtsI/penicillin-binding protein 2
LTAELVKTKVDIEKKNSYSYSSRWPILTKKKLPIKAKIDRFLTFMLIIFLLYTLQCVKMARFDQCFLYLAQIFEPAIAAPQKVASAQLCDSTAKTSFEMEDSLSVRTDFSSSNKRSARSKDKNNDKNAFTAFISTHC